MNSELDQKKLTFNITYYSVFQNVRNILQESHILPALDQEYKKVFRDITVVGFCNGKIFKDHLVKAKLPNVEILERSKPCWKRNS